MILAAGLGTRLRPLTDHTPKVLIEIAGRPILAWIGERLAAAGADRIVINVHHHADQIERFVETGWDIDAEPVLSFEIDRPLGTGGGLLHAAPHFRGDRTILLHVGDVITDLDLAGLAEHHIEGDAAVTLAVHDRETERFLRFDDAGLSGREDLRRDLVIEARPPIGPVRRFAFAGVHAISPDLIERFTERGAFGILEPYLRLAAEGTRIAPHDVTGAEWLELGNPERLEQARRALSGEA